VIEKDVEIGTVDGAPEAVLFRPDGAGHWPGVLHLTDVGGIRASHREMARRLAAHGYVVLMPNVFYRTCRPPMFDFKPNFADERTKKRFAELVTPLTPDAMELDGVEYVRFLEAEESVSNAPIGVVGYCFTGAMALRTAAARPDKIGAAASFHSGGLYTESPTSPHLVVPRVKARLYFGHAIEDHFMPAAAIEKLDRALYAWERPVRKRSLCGIPSWLDRARQSGVSPTAIRSRFREADAVVREHAATAQDEPSRVILKSTVAGVQLGQLPAAARLPAPRIASWCARRRSSA